MTPRQEWRSQCCNAPVTGMGINDTIVEPPGCTKCNDRCQPIMCDIENEQKEWWSHHVDRLGTWKWEPEELRVFLAPIITEAIARGIAQAGEMVLPRIGKFIDKVESGRAKSKETYADMLDIVEWFDEQMR